MLDSVLYDLGKALATLAAEKLKEEYTLLVGVREECKKLQTKLNTIKPVLGDAEERALMEENVKCWLDDLKDVVYDIEDVLYDWTMEVDRNGGKPKHDDIDQTHCSCFKPIKKVQNRRDISRRIKAINLRLDEINKLKNDYKFESRRESDPSLIPRVLTTSFGEVKDLHAQTIIKQKVKALLRPAQGTDGGSKIQIILLVGMGGIGKTTIAKIVYNDADVKSHFNKLMWVCVSDPFSKINVSKAILNFLCDNSSSEQLQQPSLLPPLGTLPSLASLVIYRMSRVRSVGEEFLGIEESQSHLASSSHPATVALFPKLKTLIFNDLPEWETWADPKHDNNVQVTNIIIMPSLSKLQIWTCYNLKSLPGFLAAAPIKELKIGGCPLIGRSVRDLREEYPWVSNIPSVVIG
ncbi:hypothetical protein Dimus_027588 [Dionaea muscipula]